MAEMLSVPQNGRTVVRRGPLIPGIPELLSASLILPEDWEMIPANIR
jgi:hypothetical protein